MKKLILLGIVAVSFAGCYNDSLEKLYSTQASVTCDTTSVQFTRDVLPIFTAYCGNTEAACHSATGSGGVNLTGYNTMLATYAGNGILVKDIMYDGSGNNMPKNRGKMPDCEINKIKRWVNLGYQNN